MPAACGERREPGGSPADVTRRRGSRMTTAEVSGVGEMPPPGHRDTVRVFPVFLVYKNSFIQSNIVTNQRNEAYLHQNYRNLPISAVLSIFHKLP